MSESTCPTGQPYPHKLTAACHPDKPSATPADELRAAAKLLRERASAVPPGKWVPSKTRTLGDPVIVNDPDRPTVLIETHAARYEDVNAYLLLVSPTIAEPLAAWLDNTAEWAATGEPCPFAEAEAVAKLILGGAA
ncbi:hypothetical protein [Amycolatopsis sp. cmx-4-54]|uniref:hypothetical protein n=1 Tax=Amycolatopsis sp. cmx-4-54 TaxID=2790936 RepID=UPI00397C0E52